MAEADRTRRRPPVSCTLCRRRKIRCDRENPCNNCLRSKKNICVYDTEPSSPYQSQPRNDNAIRKRRPENRAGMLSVPRIPFSKVPPASSVTSSPANTSISSSLPSVEAATIQAKIKGLEEELLRVTPASTLEPQSFNSSLGGTFHIHQARLFGKSPGVVNSVTHKTRTFGQSHWINGAVLIQDTIEMIEPYLRDNTSKILSNMQRCKHLARTIKLRRVPSWPSQPSADLPSKEVCDQLVDGYLQTIESVYRILHIPNFRRDYEALWASDTKPVSSFLVLLKLVLAIGATMYDDSFSLRQSAIRWTYEAQTFISEPRFKSTLAIQYLQIQILLLIARETADVSCEMIWISVGTLYRTAIQMGLHRDPSRLPQSTLFLAEMRRRLWNTILEISVQASLTSGGPPLTSLTDFNTDPPRNLDDEQLLIDNSVPKSEDEFTSASVAIALRTTLPLRLAVTKLLNDATPYNTYEATLQLDADLKVSYRTLWGILQKFKPSSASLSTRYAMRMVDIIMHRYLSALHIPFFGPAFHETAYAFSRKVVIESSLKVWQLAFPTSFAAEAPAVGGMNPPERDNLARLMICGAGFFRTVIFQATFTIAIELKSLLQEQQGLGPISPRLDLLSVVEGAKKWCFSCIEAGETSVKGYLFLSVISAQVEGLKQGLGKDELPKLLVKAAEEAEERCIPILEAANLKLETGEESDGFDPSFSNVSPETSEDWDFMMSDAMFQAGDTDPMTWTFGDELMQEPSFW